MCILYNGRIVCRARKNQTLNNELTGVEIDWELVAVNA
jgi:hypothetical protein